VPVVQRVVQQEGGRVPKLQEKESEEVGITDAPQKELGAAGMRGQL